MKNFTLENLYRGIGMTGEMEAAVASISFENGEYEYCRRLFNTDLEDFFAYVNKKEKRRLYFMKLYLLFACAAYERYRAEGIPETVYFDTFKDIVCWAHNCSRDYGEVGIEQYDWLWRHVKLKLFRLGRLQYEVVKGEEEPELNKRRVGPGTTVLNLHIPQGEPLVYGKCVESLRLAENFFADYRDITCHSWLLSPMLKEILPEDSNIIRFQSLFTVYALDETSREAEERVFNRLEEDASAYPENTVLQRALKEYLLKGRNPGGGYGMINFQTCKSRTYEL